MDLINDKLIIFDMPANDKDEVIKNIAAVMEDDARLKNKDGYVADVFKREDDSPTSFGFLIAIPHAKSEHVKEPSLAFARLKEPIEWSGEDVQLVFQIAVPSPGQDNQHLQILAQISRKLMDEDFRNKLLKSQNAENVLELLNF